MPISETEGYFENLSYRFLEITMVFLLALNETSKAFSSLKTKSNSIFAVKLTKRSQHPFSVSIWWGQRKVVLFLEIGWVKNIFFHLPTRIVSQCVSEYIFLISKNKLAKKKTKTRIQKKEIKLKKENISEKSIKKIAAASLAFPETKVFFWPELHFSNFCALNVCVITERLEINRLCKHMKNVRSSQAFILVMNWVYSFFGIYTIFFL